MLSAMEQPFPLSLEIQSDRIQQALKKEEMQVAKAREQKTCHRQQRKLKCCPKYCLLDNYTNRQLRKIMRKVRNVALSSPPFSLLCGYT